MFIDTHSHLNFKAFDEDRDEVIKRTLANDTWIINPSSNLKTSALAVEIAQQYQQGVFASIGLHPLNCVIDLSHEDEDRLEELNIESYRQLSFQPKVVAIGEIGLDYWNEPKSKIKARMFKAKQQEVFIKQLDLAQELNLPVILHCRKAHEDLIAILEHYPAKKSLRGVLHCFTGTWEQAQRLLKLGFYLGFNGIIFKFDVKEVIKKAPIERMLIETDCPFLTPPLARHSLSEGGLARRSPAISGTKVAAFAEVSASQRNEPLNVKYVAQKIAEIRKKSLDEIAQTTSINAKRLFGL